MNAMCYSINTVPACNKLIIKLTETANPSIHNFGYIGTNDCGTIQDSMCQMIIPISMN